MVNIHIYLLYEMVKNLGVCWVSKCRYQTNDDS